MQPMTATDLGLVLNAMVKHLDPQIENPYAHPEHISRAMFIQELLKAGIKECLRQVQESANANS